MKLTNALQRNLDRFTDEGLMCPYGSNESYDCGVFIRNAYSKFMKISINLNEPNYIPFFMVKYITKLMNGTVGYGRDKFDIVLPLHWQYSEIVRGFASFMTKTSLIRRANQGMLKQLTEPSGTIWYVRTGLIMDNNFNITVMPVAKVEFNKEKPGFKVTEFILNVNPKVFMSDNKLVCTNILKTMIPYYLKEGVYCSYGYTYSDLPKCNGKFNYYEPTIEVKDRTKEFVVSVAQPTTIEECEDAGDILVNHLDAIENNFNWDNN